MATHNMRKNKRVAETNIKRNRKTVKTRTKTIKASRDKVASLEPSLISMAAVGTEKRFSFVVRVTVDELGQPRRTEVEHAQSGKRESFPAWDIVRLAEFMSTCFSPSATIPSFAIPTRPIIKAPGLAPRPQGSAGSLVISDVKILKIQTQSTGTLILSPGKAFLVQVWFELQGSDHVSVTDAERFYQIEIRAREVTSGASRLLAAHRDNLARGLFHHTIQLETPGLPTGIYSFMTSVVIDASPEKAAYFDGPVLQVAAMNTPD